MMKKLLLLVFIFFCGSYAFAQVAYNLKLVPSFSSTEDSLYIDFIIRRTSTQSFTLGNSNFVVDLNAAALDINSMAIVEEGRWSPSQNPDQYSDISLGKGAGGDYISLNISTVTSSGMSGVDVPTTDALLARIKLKITDCNQTHNLQWRSSAGVINDYNGNDIKPFAVFNNPANGPLKVKIAAPAVSSSSGASNIFFQWNQVAEASRYDITFDSGATWKNLQLATSFDSTGLSFGDSLVARVRAIRLSSFCNDTSYSAYVKEKITACANVTYDKSADTSFCQLGSTHEVWVKNFSPSADYEVSWNDGPFQGSSVADYNKYTVDISSAGMQIIRFALRKANNGGCVTKDSIKVDVSPVDPAWTVAGGSFTFCIADPAKRLIPASGGGVFSGPGVYFDTSLNQYFFKAQNAGAGEHNIIYNVCGIQQSHILTVANAPCVSTLVGPGSGPHGTDYVRQPQGIFTDCNGTVFVSDSRNHVIRKIDTLGNVSTIAGREPYYDPEKQESTVFSGDNAGDVSALNSLLNNPMGIVVLKNGDVYFNDSFNHKLKKISNGVVSTVAGDPSLAPARGNVPLPGGAAVSGLSARFAEPTGLAVDPAEQYLYIADKENYQIKRYTIATGEVVSFAGSGSPGYANGDAVQAKFGMLASLTADANRLYVADRGNNTIRIIKIASDINVGQNQVSNLTNGDGSLGNRYQDGNFAQHRTNNPYGVSVDGSGQVFFADTDNHSIRKVDSTGSVITIAGSMPPTAINGFVSGSAAESRFDQPTALSVYIKGFLDVADTRNNAIRRIAIDNYREGMWNGLNLNYSYCLGEPADTLQPNNGGGYYKGPEDVLKKVDGKYVFVPSKVGTYTITYIYAVGGCTEEFTQQVLVYPAPQSALKDTTILCSGAASVVLTAGDASQSYKWTGPNGFTSTDPSVAVSEPGKYTVEVTNSAGCKKLFSSIVKQGPKPTGVATANPDKVCAGSGTIISASFDSGFTPDSVAAYSFDGGSNFQASATYTVPAIYSDTTVVVRLRDINGCVSDPINVRIQIQALPQPTVSATANPVCFGGSTIVSAGSLNGAVAAQNGYSFDGGKTFQTGNSISLSNLEKDTTISVVIVSADGCRSNVSNYTVKVVPLPTGKAEVDNKTVCYNASATITATFDEGFTPHSEGGYSFDGGNTFQTSNKLVLNALQADTVVKVVFRDANGCLSQVYSENITVKPDLALTLTANASADSVCKGSPVSITASYEGTATGIQFSFDNGQTYGSANNLMIPAVNSDTIIKVKVKDASGCESSTLNVPVKLYKPKATVQTAQLVCENSPARVTVNMLSGYTPAAEAYSFDGGSSYQASNVFEIANIAADTTVLVRVKDVNGCLSDLMPVSIQTQKRPEGTAIALDNYVCSGTNVRIEAMFTNGIPHAQGGYALQGGQFQTSNILIVNNLQRDTTVYVLLRGSNNCLSQPIPVQINVNPKPEGTASANPSTICSGGSTVIKATLDPAFTANSEGTYSFNNGPFTNADTLRLYNLRDAQTVLVRFRDKNGCISDPITVNVNVSPLIQVKAEALPDSVCQGSSTTLKAQFVGGAILHPQGSYSFDGGVTFSNTNHYETGAINKDTTFSVVLRNEQSCFSDTIKVPVRIYKPKGYIEAEELVCEGSNVTVTAGLNTGYVPAASNAYSFDGGNTFGDSKTIQLNALKNDTTITVVIRDQNNCLTEKITKTIRVNAKPTGMAVAAETCKGSDAVVSASFVSGTPHTQGAYSLDGQVFVSSDQLTVGNVQKDTVVSVWLRDINGCISDPISVTIKVLPLPMGSVSASTDTACYGTEVVVTAKPSESFVAHPDGGYSFDGGKSFVQDNKLVIEQIEKDTTINVVFRDVNGCRSILYPVSIKVREDQANWLTASVSEDSLCAGSPVKVTATYSGDATGVLYSFDGGLTFTENKEYQIAAINSDTAINVVVKDSFGCISSAVKVPVSIYPVPAGVLNADATAICINTGTTLTAVGNTAFIPNSMGAYSFDGGLTFTTSNKLFLEGLVRDTTVTLVLKDERGCVSKPIQTHLKVVAQPAAAINEAGSMEMCEGATRTLTAEGGTRYQWLKDGNIIEGQTTDKLTVSASGIYNVVAFNETGCSDTADVAVDVKVQSLPAVNLGNDIIACEGDEVVLDAGVDGASYSWNGDASLNTKQLKVTESGKYSVQVMTPLGCISADEVNVTFLRRPQVSLEEPGTYCNNKTITLVADIAGDNLEVVWSTTGAGTLTANSNGSMALYEAAREDIGDIYFTVKVFNACDTATATASADMSFAASAAFTPSSREVFPNEEIRFTIDRPEAAAKYFWSFGDGQTSTDLNPVHKFTSGIEYTVRLVAESNTGCMDTSEVVISVINNQLVYVPNIFSPGASHPDNRALKVFGTNIQATDFLFRVYNRWGQVVYETSSLSQAKQVGWNGGLHNSLEEQPIGVYTYTVRGKYLDGTSFEKVGTATLMK